MSESTKITGAGPFGQCGVAPSHDGTARGQAPVPGGLIGSAGVEPSETIFRAYRLAASPAIATGRLTWCIWLAMGVGGLLGSVLSAAVDPLLSTGLSVVLIVVSFVAIERIDDRAFRKRHGID